MKKAFTLIELLVVVSIIFLLTSIFISNAQEAKLKARDAADKEQVRQVQIAMAGLAEKNRQTPGQAYASRTGTQFIPGLYAEKSTQFNNAVGELVTQKYLSSMPKSSDGESLFYVETENDAALIAALDSEQSALLNKSCHTDNPDFKCAITYYEDGSFDIDIDYKGQNLYNKKVTKDDDGNLVVSDPEPEIPEGELVTDDLMWVNTQKNDSWSTANTYCGNLYSSGFDNWRLPTASEMLQAFNDGIIQPNQYVNFCYWTSNVFKGTYTIITDEGVQTTTGLSFRPCSTSDTYYCVRDVNGGDRLPPPVMWEYVTTTSRTGNWDSANNYCSALVNKGTYSVNSNIQNWYDPIKGYPNPPLDYSDWRLPTVDQLKNAFGTGGNDGFRGGGYYYWSGDPDTEFAPGEYWAVNNPNYTNPYTGVTNGLNENYNYRCVRYAI